MRHTWPAIASFEDGKQLQAKEYGQILEAGASRRNRALRTLWFKLSETTEDFWAPEL